MAATSSYLDRPIRDEAKASKDWRTGRPYKDFEDEELKLGIELMSKKLDEAGYAEAFYAEARDILQKLKEELALRGPKLSLPTRH
jgi:hypothetical protein